MHKARCRHMCVSVGLPCTLWGCHSFHTSVCSWTQKRMPLDGLCVFVCMHTRMCVHALNVGDLLIIHKPPEISRMHWANSFIPSCLFPHGMHRSLKIRSLGQIKGRVLDSLHQNYLASLSKIHISGKIKTTTYRAGVSSTLQIPRRLYALSRL